MGMCVCVCPCVCLCPCMCVSVSLCIYVVRDTETGQLSVHSCIQCSSVVGRGYPRITCGSLIRVIALTRYYHSTGVMKTMARRLCGRYDAGHLK